MNIIDIDTEGRITTLLGQSEGTPGVLTNVGDTVVLNMFDYSAFSVLLGVGSTFAAATVVMESTMDAGVSWQPLLVVRTDIAGAPTSNLISAAASSVVSFLGAAPVASQVRARLTAITSGSVSIRMAASASSISPITQTHAVTGAVTTTPTNPTTTNTECAATTNAVANSSASCLLMELTVFNPTAATIYLKLFNKATAPTVGTDTPITTIPVLTGEFKSVVFGSSGKRFSTGLGWCTTAGAIKTDAVAIAAGVQVSITKI